MSFGVNFPKSYSEKNISPKFSLKGGSNAKMPIICSAAIEVNSKFNKNAHL